MPSLTQLLTSHSRLLVLDASSMKTQVGLLGNSADGIWRSTEGEAGKEIFAGIEIVLHEAGIGLGEVDAFVFCEGPGSMLGIRTVVMALRTWQVLKLRPVYACQSLVVAGHFEWMQKAPRSFFVITDARRDTWHCQSIDADGEMPSLQRVPAAELPAGELVTPENFRAWANPPRSAGICSYDLARIFPAIATGDYFRKVETPDAFQHEAPAYKKWSAQIHQATTIKRGLSS